MAIETKEITFEREIEYSLLDHGGYIKAIPMTTIGSLPLIPSCCSASSGKASPQSGPSCARSMAIMLKQAS